MDKKINELRVVTDKPGWMNVTTNKFEQQAPNRLYIQFPMVCLTEQDGVAQVIFQGDEANDLIHLIEQAKKSLAK